jgi:YD repeat-containing protein
MKPETMPRTAWNVIFANLAAGVGQTWGDYINTLSDNAAFLYRHGGKTENGTGRLMQFELLQAMGHSPITTLESSTDLVVEAPGMPLTFARYSGNSIVKRHKTGPLGKGWVHNWQLAVAEEADGDVVLTAMNSPILFTLDSRGGYFSPAGLDGRLSKAGDIFTFTASDGVKTVFNAGGSLNFIEDLNGNRITATYSDGLLTTLTHSSGKYLAIGYSGGLISSVTDNSGGLSVAYFYSGTGDSLAAVTDIHGRTTEYAYRQSGMAVQALETVYLPDGTENSYSYDEKGRLSAISFNANPPLTIGYDSAATVTLTDTASGAQYRYYYDDLGQFVEYADPLGATIYADYDANSNLTGLQQPDGKVMAFYYDTKSNLTHLFDQLQQETRFIYCDLPKSSHTLCRISGHKKSVVFWCFAELNRSFGEDVA